MASALRATILINAFDLVADSLDARLAVEVSPAGNQRWFDVPGPDDVFDAMNGDMQLSGNLAKRGDLGRGIHAIDPCGADTDCPPLQRAMEITVSPHKDLPDK